VYKTTNKFQKAVLLWLYDPATRDATILKKALSENNLDLRVATEVVCSRTPTQLQHLRSLYLTMFGGYLEHDIETHASGSHKKLLLAYLTMPRYEGPEIDSMVVVEDAKALYKAGEKRFGTDEKTFRRIFCERSRAHLAAVSATYNQNHGNSLEKAIKGETSGHFCYALKAILHCAENPGLFFAKIMYKAMKGIGTNDTTLIRIIVTRAEIDMAYIKSEYHRKYGKSLHDVVHSETSSHYRTFLLSLIGHPPAY
jgi:annexin A7/11